MIRIHIDRKAMQRSDPCIVVEPGGPQAFHHERADIEGPSAVVFSPRGMPSAQGPRRPVNVWVETDSPVVADGKRYV